ncbi:MAG: hypothetical protein WCP46_03350 [Alphaproteobacteria bacterium]
MQVVGAGAVFVVNEGFKWYSYREQQRREQEEWQQLVNCCTLTGLVGVATMVPYMAYRWLWCSSEPGNLSQDEKSEIKIIESLSPSIKEGNFVEPVILPSLPTEVMSVDTSTALTSTSEIKAKEKLNTENNAIDNNPTEVFVSEATTSSNIIGMELQTTANLSPALPSTSTAVTLLSEVKMNIVKNMFLPFCVIGSNSTEILLSEVTTPLTVTVNVTASESQPPVNEETTSVCITAALALTAIGSYALYKHLYKTLPDAAAAAVPAVGNIAQPVLSAASNAVSSGVSVASDAVSSGMSAVSDAVSSGMSVASDAVSSGVSAVKEDWNKICTEAGINQWNELYKKVGNGWVYNGPQPAASYFDSSSYGAGAQQVLPMGDMSDSE